MQRETFEQRISAALSEVGFLKADMEYIAASGLTVAKAEYNPAAKNQSLRRLRAEIRRTFGRRGLRTMTPLIKVFKERNKIFVQIGVKQFGSMTARSSLSKQSQKS